MKRLQVYIQQMNIQVLINIQKMYVMVRQNKKPYFLSASATMRIITIMAL